MAEFGGTTLTNSGRTLLAKAIAGAPIKFTRGAAGDGVLPAGLDIAEMTGLVAPIRDMPIVDIEVPPLIGTAKITAILSNKDVPQGFFVREVGLFAEDPDTGEELLYCYSNAGNRADFMPGYGGADTLNYQLVITTVVGQAEEVTAVFVENPLAVTHIHLKKRLEYVLRYIRDRDDEMQRQIDALAEASILSSAGRLEKRLKSI